VLLKKKRESSQQIKPKHMLTAIIPAVNGRAELNALPLALSPVKLPITVRIKLTIRPITITTGEMAKLAALRAP